MSIEKRIECVKEFFLRTLFTSEKLDVVNQEEIHLTITLAEFDQIAVLDRVEYLFNKQSAQNIDHLHFFLLPQDELAKSLHRVGLAKADTAINEQRVVRARGRLRHRESGGMRNFIVRTNHEGFKRVPWIESRHGCAWFCVGRRSGENFFQRQSVLGGHRSATSPRRAERYQAGA